MMKGGESAVDSRDAKVEWTRLGNGMEKVEVLVTVPPGTQVPVIYCAFEALQVLQVEHCK